MTYDDQREVFFGGFEDVQHMAHQCVHLPLPGQARVDGVVSAAGLPVEARLSSRGAGDDVGTPRPSVTVTFWSNKRWDIEAKSSGPTSVDSGAPLSGSRA